MRRLLLAALLCACGGTPSETPPNPGSNIPAVTYDLTLQAVGSGSISGLGSPCSGQCTYPIVAGTQLSLVATPADGFRFDRWSGACTGSSQCTVTMNANLAVTATFVRDPQP
jgi:hypothetical protein